MTSQAASFRALHFATLDSTNEEALRQFAQGAEPPLWIVAEEQSRGRGRNGRTWQSPKGNLYASLLLRLGTSASVASGLSLVAGLAAYDAVAAHINPALGEKLRLKWPNDVLLGGAKAAGILIESFTAPKGGIIAIAGIGINVSAAPAGTGRPVAALGGDPSACAPVFEALASAFERWLVCWNEGAGFDAIRKAWLERAHVPGELINADLNGAPIRGKFRGIDSKGALQLETEPGAVITVNAGDIYPDAQGWQ